MKNQNNIELELRKFVAPEYVFGVDARKLAANYCKKYGAKKVFLVTDAGLLSTQWIKEFTDSLNDNHIDFIKFSNISPNPRDYEVAEGTGLYLENHCNLILAIGGGSVMDCAKAIGIVATNKKTIDTFEGVDMISNSIPPLICIPTTGGSSADVSQFAIINNTKEKYKMAIISKAIVPDVALIDPLVLTSMDNFLTACTGIDALTHAIEAYVSNASSAFTDLYAREAIKLIADNLELNINDPFNIQARGKIMLASMYAGLAFSNASLGSLHSLAHSLGGYLDLPHGECNAILLPHIIDYNFSFSEDKFKDIAILMGTECKGNNTSEYKSKLINKILSLKHKMGINSTLKDKGVSVDIISVLSSKAILDPCNATNPRRPVQEDFNQILKEAI